jgi:DNA-binding transcriptional MerR regulator
VTLKKRNGWRGKHDDFIRAARELELALDDIKTIYQQETAQEREIESEEIETIDATLFNEAPGDTTALPLQRRTDNGRPAE